MTTEGEINTWLDANNELYKEEFDKAFADILMFGGYTLTIPMNKIIATDKKVQAHIKYSTAKIIKNMEEITKHKGLRFNEGKLRFDLVHPFAHEEMVKVLTKGANKYAPRNWENGMAWSNVISSLKRHLSAIEKGEDYDSETGLLHAAHLACNAHFLTAYYKMYPQGDDRPHSYLQPKRIGLDIDEVLCDFVTGYCEKTNLDLPENWSFDNTMMAKFSDWGKTEELNNFYKALKPLINNCDIPFEPICYITNRPVDTELTKTWLQKHNFALKPVFTTTSREEKVKLALEQKLDYFIDDSYDTFVKMNQAGICCFLMDARHNRQFSVGYKRVYSLTDFKERFL